MSFQDDDILKIWEGIFSNDDYRLKIADLAANYLEKKSVYVPYPDIDAYNPDFATYILEKPDRCIRLGEKVIRQKLPPTWDPADNINLGSRSSRGMPTSRYATSGRRTWEGLSHWTVL